MKQGYEFDRFRRGRKMAHGVTIFKAKSAKEALRKARQLCGNNKNDTFVLVKQPVSSV